MLADISEKSKMEGRQAPIRIQAPKLEQEELSFCDGTLESFEAWAKELPMANVGVSAKLLYQATREMNITAIATPLRYRMLEIIRTPVHNICTLLSKRFLNQSIALTNSDLKVVQLAQTLQTQLAAGYKHIVIASLSDIKTSNPKLLTFSIHRAISELSQSILRAYQLYGKPPENAWLETHQLYALAESKGLTDYSVKDSHCKYVDGSTIHDNYCQALLLGCCKPNQLRQKELFYIYHATELWAQLVRISEAEDPQALFLVPLNKDVAPTYRNLAQQAAKSITRGLNPKSLIMALQKRIDKETDVVTIPENITDSVLTHLLHAWGDMIERSFKRTPNTGEVELGFGFLSSHYFMANKYSLSFLLKKWNVDIPKKKEQKSSGDVWDKSFDADGFGTDASDISFDSVSFIKSNTEEEVDVGSKGTLYKSTVTNTSPGGYGISIENPPSNVQTGELVVIKEARSREYALGSIRWISTNKKTATEIGLELIAPSAQAVAVRILNKTGENGEFLRGLYIPAMPAAGLTETLILPIVPFKLGAKVELATDSSQQRIQLLQRHHASRSYVQYSYKSLNQITPKSEEKDLGEDNFDSIWDKL